MAQPEVPPLSLAIDQARIRAYADLTGDANPLHLDAAFAATTRLGGIVAHGTLGSNLVWQMFDAAGVDVAEVQLRFLAPVRPGDTVTAVAEARPEGGYRVAIRNQHGQEVVAGTATTPESA